MLTIKIEEDFKDAVKEMGMEVLGTSTVMTVRDGNELMGIGVMRLFDEFATIDNICIKEEYKDFTLEYGLGKSMLNAVDLRGIRYAVSDNENIEKQLRALKFKSPCELDNTEEYPKEVADRKFCLCLDGYFLAKC